MERAAETNGSLCDAGIKHIACPSMPVDRLPQSEFGEWFKEVSISLLCAHALALGAPLGLWRILTPSLAEALNASSSCKALSLSLSRTLTSLIGLSRNACGIEDYVAQNMLKKVGKRKAPYIDCIGSDLTASTVKSDKVGLTSPRACARRWRRSPYARD